MILSFCSDTKWIPMFAAVTRHHADIYFVKTVVAFLCFVFRFCLHTWKFMMIVQKIRRNILYDASQMNYKTQVHLTINSMRMFKWEREKDSVCVCVCVFAVLRFEINKIIKCYKPANTEILMIEYIQMTIWMYNISHNSVFFKWLNIISN